MKTGVRAGLSRTNANTDPTERKPRHGILEQVWPAGTEEGGTGAVVFPVVRGVEAGGDQESTLANVSKA